MGNTIDNLKAAFAGESQANRTYLAFAKKADEEGFPQAARLFRAAAEAETVQMLGIYERFAGEWASVPVISGLKTEREKRSYRAFSKLFNDLLASTTVGDSNFSDMKQVFQEIQKQSVSEARCLELFLQRRRRQGKVGYSFLGDRDSARLARQFENDTVIGPRSMLQRGVVIHSKTRLWPEVIVPEGTIVKEHVLNEDFDCRCEGS